MASSTGHPVSRDIYWKRRAFVFAGVLLVLTLIVWACRPSSEEDGTTRSDASLEEPSPSVPPEEDGATAGPEADPSDGEAGAGDDPEASPSAGEGTGEAVEAGGSGGSGGSGGAEGGSGAGAAAPEKPEDLCRPQDVVVTFDFAKKDKEVYGAGEQPGFEVTVVNTSDQTCTVDVGGEALEVRIHSGDDRIFSTADCAEGESDRRQLERGVPHEITVDWDRTRSFTDCRDDVVNAKPGWYRANLHGGLAGDTSQLVFQIKA
ncbi:hypothetical protein ACOALZ_09180 [Nocardiopsis algeriensis]|uniref:hypothetical protein n=1 Tax=Nocardiopsis algeriensis TaxID=1478215 RepID=UPI003B42EEE7